MSLSLFIIVPVVTAVLVLAAGDRRPLLVRWISLVANLVNLVLALAFWLGAGAATAGAARPSGPAGPSRASAYS